MHLIEIPERNIKRFIPEDLSECDKSQYINISSLIYKYTVGKIDYDLFKTQALYYLLNMKHVTGDVKEEIKKYTNITILSDLLESFFETDTDGKKIIKQYYIKNPIHIVSNGLKKWYGPTDEFQNVNFGEYVDGLNHYEDFHETGEAQYLYYLMATFYRPSKIFLAIKKLTYNYNKDPRKKYNTDALFKISSQLKQFPIGIPFGFYLLFASFQKYLTTASFWIQGREINLSLLYQNSETQDTKSTIPGIGLRSMLYTMAESGVFGTLEEVRNTSLYEVLIRMYDMRKRDIDNKPKK
jgi:hypothetical protein